VAARGDDVHDDAVGEHRGDGEAAAGERLPEDEHVRPHRVVVDGQHLARAAEPRLDLQAMPLTNRF
jgi:hypothetical protein